ncbi:MAG: hypothetical protein ACRD1Z_11310, partial [Vicinamibacteria bacterium]
AKNGRASNPEPALPFDPLLWRNLDRRCGRSRRTWRRRRSKQRLLEWNLWLRWYGRSDSGRSRNERGGNFLLGDRAGFHPFLLECEEAARECGQILLETPQLTLVPPDEKESDGPEDKQ